MNYGREAKGRSGWQREDPNEDFLCRIQCVYLEWTNDKMQIIPSACSLRVLVPCSRAVTSPSVHGEYFCSFGVDILHVPLFPLVSSILLETTKAVISSLIEADQLQVSLITSQVWLAPWREKLSRPGVTAKPRHTCTNKQRRKWGTRREVESEPGHPVGQVKMKEGGKWMNVICDMKVICDLMF